MIAICSIESSYVVGLQDISINTKNHTPLCGKADIVTEALHRGPTRPRSCQMLFRPLSVCHDAGPVPGDELIGDVIQIIADELRLRADP